MTQPIILTENYQIQLPEQICRQLHLVAGQHFICLIKGNVINLVPQKNIFQIRGLLKGANTENVRDRSDI